MSRKNTWSRCHVCGDMTCVQDEIVEMSMHQLALLEKQLRNWTTVLDLDNEELKKKKHDRWNWMRKRNEDDRERRRAHQLQECSKRSSYSTYSFYFYPFPQCLPQRCIIKCSMLTSAMHNKVRFEEATDMSRAELTFYFFKINNHQCWPFTKWGTKVRVWQPIQTVKYS